MTKKKIDEIFFQLFCEKNSNGTIHLRLRGNELIQRIQKRLTKDDMHELAKFLKRDPRIVSVDLAYNNLADDGLKILAEEFFNRKNNLQFLNLMHCDIEGGGMSSLSSARYVKLKTIRLAGNRLGAEGARFIGELIEKCPTLEGLDIGQTDQTLESIESLLMTIETSKIKFLNISRIIPKSCYSQYNNSTLAHDIGVLLKLNTSLKEIRAQKCELDGYDVDLLIEGLEIHNNLVMLDLSANKIADHGVALIANWLGTRPNLIALRLASNEIGNSGAKSLALNLAFSKLKVLDIHNNDIRDPGLSDILDSVHKCPRMQKLYFWGNKFGQVSLTKLEKALKVGTLEQRHIDVKIYTVDGLLCAAYYPTNHYRSSAFCVVEYGRPPELRIKRNKSHAVKGKRSLGLHYTESFAARDLFVKSPRSHQGFLDKFLEKLKTG